MNKTGFIGFGAMGGIIAEALVKNNAIPAGKIVLNTRTPSKMKSFLERYPEAEAAGSVQALAGKCSRIFICTGTKEVKAVVEELVGYLQENAHLITITGIIEMKCLESIFTGAITRIMPTQIAEAGEGVTLILHNAKVASGERELIRKAFSKIGRVKEITESQMDLAADLASCAPAFYAAILKHVVAAAEKHGGMAEKDIREISLATAEGTIKLLTDRNLGFEELIRRVATPGGITEEGVKILDRALPAVFNEVFTTTLSKREKLRKQMCEQYGVV